MNYRNVEITLREAPDFGIIAGKVGGTPRQVYSVHTDRGLVFRASSKFGDCYGLDTERVLADAKAMIDANLDPMTPSAL